MIYLLHFDPPFHHARHYLGFTENLAQRMATHTGQNGGSGYGSKLVTAARAAGSKIILARVWPDGTRDQERMKKNRGKTRICPVCDGSVGHDCQVLPENRLTLYPD